AAAPRAAAHTSQPHHHRRSAPHRAPPTELSSMSIASRITQTCILLALVAAVLALPAPASAASECVPAARGALANRSDSTITDLAEADILAACVVHDADTLEVAVRVASPTDPATDPAWANFDSAVGAAVDVDGDGEEDFDVNYGRFPDGQIRVTVFE